MASNKSVVVLAPNGRRQTVKVTPNTTILQILEEVCEKQGFKSEEYDLKHHNNVLDVTAIVRFSGLPNNATLEMCTVQKIRKEGMVTVGVQLENGERLTGDFSPDENLWNIIMQLCPEEAVPHENLVIIYMRQEFHGKDSVAGTTLRSVGLTAGRAMFRLIHRSPEQLRKQANVSAPLPSKPAVEKPYVRKLQKLDDNWNSVITAKTNEGQEGNSRKNEASSSQPTECPSPKEQKGKSDFLMDFIRKEKGKKSPSSKVSKTSQPKLSTLSSGRKLREEPMEVDQFASTSKCQNIEEVQDQRCDDFAFLGERNAMAFSLEMADAVPHEDLPDEFFELTIQDARKLFHDLKKKREDLENRPLETEAQRKLEESKKILRNMNKYKSSVIRIQFPDRTVLQGTFKPVETIEKVMDFVKDYIQDSTPEFYLYTTPPKKILDPTKTLVESDCVPSAVVHFGVHQALPQDFTYLCPAVFSHFVSPSIASIAATKLMVKNPKGANFENDDPEDPGPSTSKPNRSYQDTKGSKWYWPWK